MAWGVMSENLIPRMWLHMWKSELLIARVHTHNLISIRRTKHLYDLNKLIDSALPRKQRLTQQHLANDAPNAPQITAHIVILRPKYELRRPIKPTAYIATIISLTLNQPLRRPKVTKLKYMALRINKQILRLQIPMSNSQRMQVSKCS